MPQFQWTIYLHTILAFSVAPIDGEPCRFVGTVKQLDFLENFNVTLECSFNSTEQITIIEWRTSVTESNDTKINTVYNAYVDLPQYDGAEGDYVGKVDGRLGEFSHYLTIINATNNDNLTIWSCIVKKPGCTGQHSNWLMRYLGHPQFAVVAMLIDGKVRTAEYESEGPVSVTCSAQSDPKAELSIADVATPQTCERLAGEPPNLWNCSVSATLPKGERDVSCRVMWNGVVQPSDTVRIKVPPTVAPTGATTSAAGGEMIDGLQAQAQTAASSSVIIGAVVAVVAVLIIAAVVGIFVYRKKKQGNGEDKGSLT